MTRREKIKAALMNMGVDPSLTGFEYLVEAVDIQIENKMNKKRWNAIETYANIGLSYNTSGGCVERAIRHAIEKAFDTNEGLIYDVFTPFICYYRRKVGNSTFISVMAERIMMGKFVFMEVVENDFT